MTPREQAKELINTMYKNVEMNDVDESCKAFLSYYHAKLNAKTCVDKILDWYKSDDMIQDFFKGKSPSEIYWREVLKEIIKS